MVEGTHLRLGDVGKPREGVVEEASEGGAVIVSGLPVLPDPVVLAAAMAERSILASVALLREVRPQLEEPGIGFPLANFLQRTGIQSSQLPLVQDVEVAGVQTSVGLGHEVAAAAAAGGAGAGVVPKENVDVVVKESDAVVLPRLPIPVPQVKKLAEKLPVGLGRQRPGPSAPGLS